jgi:hypothetical protein
MFEFVCAVSGELSHWRVLEIVEDIRTQGVHAHRE